MDASPSLTPCGRRIAGQPWAAIESELDLHGAAVIPGLLAAEDCAAVAGWYDAARLFRSTVVMSRHGFGRGEYRYFAYPLPDLVAGLRTALYPPLAAIANRWNATLGEPARFPAAHADYLA